MPEGATEKFLDPTKPQEVSYAIPTWLRDEQIKIACRKVKGRIEPWPDHTKPRPDPIAIVCAGPSLNDTWEEVKKFKYIISMSISGKYLIERGIIPTWHAAVDPRRPTVDHIGTPHPDVEYLISSTCHPDVFDHLAKHNAKVKLWHVYDSTENGFRLWPHGEWAIMGGLNVGLRALNIAYFMGFRDMHVFGMDGSEGKTGKHAAAHSDQAPASFPCEYPPNSGKIWRTTPAFLEAARGTFHELDMLGDKVKVKFYGEGLVQEMHKYYVRKTIPKGTPQVAQYKEPMISEHHREMNRQLHEENPTYGVGGGKHKDAVLRMREALKKALKKDDITILDYGCGRGYLAKELGFPIYEYDPAIPGKDVSPPAADLVICTDVLEHIEYDRLDPVLSDISRCARHGAYLVIHLTEAKKKYADGTNTHLIQQTIDWWTHRLKAFFKVTKVKEIHDQNKRPIEVRFYVSNKPINMQQLVHVTGNKGDAVQTPVPGALPPSPAEAGKFPPKGAEISASRFPKPPAPPPMSVVPETMGPWTPSVMPPPPEPLRIVIGGTRKDKLPSLVLEHTIRKVTTVPVQIIHTWDKALPARPCPTGFSYVRFQVPELAGGKGRAVYFDSDMLVYQDLAELAALDMQGKIVMRPPNQSAVMLYNCEKYPWRIGQIFDALDQQRVTYKDIIWKLWPMRADEIGVLDPRWNVTDEWTDGAKLFHYTKVATQPWLYPDHPEGWRWYEAMVRAMQAGVVTREIIDEEISLKHLIPNVRNGGRERSISQLIFETVNSCVVSGVKPV